jgi:hypothetical protein
VSRRTLFDCLHEAVNQQVKAIGVATDLRPVGAVADSAQPAMHLVQVQVGSHKPSAASDVAPISRAPRTGALMAGGEATETSFSFTVASIIFSGSIITATDFLPFPLSLCGIYSSRTAWKFVPPKPRALKPARRTESDGTVHGFSSVARKQVYDKPNVSAFWENVK